MINADRTANRHRCSGRVAPGVRVILRQGTRQYSDRNFGIRSAPSHCLSGETCQFSFQETIREMFEKKADLCSQYLIGSVRGPQLKNPCNCLLKTQVSANTKVEV